MVQGLWFRVYGSGFMVLFFFFKVRMTVSLYARRSRLLTILRVCSFCRSGINKMPHLPPLTLIIHFMTLNSLHVLHSIH